jgi:hypothetical protein
MVYFLFSGLHETLRCEHCQFKHESWTPWDHVHDRTVRGVRSYYAAQVDNHPTHRHPDWDEETA